MTVPPVSCAQVRQLPGYRQTAARDRGGQTGIECVARSSTVLHMDSKSQTQLVNMLRLIVLLFLKLSTPGILLLPGNVDAL